MYVLQWESFIPTLLDELAMGEKVKAIDIFTPINSDSEQEFDISKDKDSDLSSSTEDEDIVAYSKRNDKQQVKRRVCTQHSKVFLP